MRTPPVRKQPPAHLAAGCEAEERACAHLRRRGLTLLERNFRCRRGEIDLIMRDGSTVVFVEVRYRRNARFGDSAETVDVRKQHRLLAAAQTYLQRNAHQTPCRFDVVAITGTELQWITNAFEADG